MSEKDHFKRLDEYFDRSKTGFNLLLWGAKHFGFHPIGRKVSEKKAQLLMQDLIGERLKLSESMRVLDAGCGQGVVSTYLAKKFCCRIEGITILRFELEAAKLLAEKCGVSDSVNYSLMDYSNMGFGDNVFDAIFTIESLSHSIDIRQTLREFFRVLKKGCRIALFEYTIAEDKAFSANEMDLLNKVIHSSAMSGLKDFRHDKFQDVIKGAGFRNVKVQNISLNVEPSLNRLRKFALLPYFFVRLFNMQSQHPNLTAAVEFYKMGKKDLFRYNIFIADK